MMDVAAVKGPSVLKHCFFPGWDPQNMIVWWFMGLCGGTAQNHLKKNMSVFCLTFLHLNTAHCRRSTEEFKTSDGVQLRNWREDLRVRMESTEVRVCRGTKTPIRETMKTVCVCVCILTAYMCFEVMFSELLWTWNYVCTFLYVGLYVLYVCGLHISSEINRQNKGWQCTFLQTTDTLTLYVWCVCVTRFCFFIFSFQIYVVATLCIWSVRFLTQRTLWSGFWKDNVLLLLPQTWLGKCLDVLLKSGFLNNGLSLLAAVSHRLG